MGNELRYNVLSPDGFTIHIEDTYATVEEAEKAAKEWVNRYKHQGYYSSVPHGRIPFDEILYYCRIIPETNSISEAITINDAFDFDEEPF